MFGTSGPSKVFVTRLQGLLQLAYTASLLPPITNITQQSWQACNAQPLEKRNLHRLNAGFSPQSIRHEALNPQQCASTTIAGTPNCRYCPRRRMFMSRVIYALIFSLTWLTPIARSQTSTTGDTKSTATSVSAQNETKLVKAVEDCAC